MPREFHTQGDPRAFFLEPILAKEGEADLFASQCLHYLIYNRVWENLSAITESQTVQFASGTLSGSDLATALKNIGKVEDITDPKLTRSLGDALFHRLSWIVPDFLGQTTTFLNERNIFTPDEITALQKYVFIPPQTRPPLKSLNMHSDTQRSAGRWSQIAGKAERKLLYAPLHRLKIRTIGKDEQPLSEIMDQQFPTLLEDTLKAESIADPQLPPPYLWQAREDVATIAQSDPEVRQALENVAVPADKLLLFMQEIIAPIGKSKAEFSDQNYISRILLASLTRWKREIAASVPDGTQLLPETVVTEEISAPIATDDVIDFSDSDLPTSLKTALLREGIKSWNFLTGMTLVQLVGYRRLGALAPLILHHGVLKNKYPDSRLASQTRLYLKDFLEEDPNKFDQKRKGDLRQFIIMLADETRNLAWAVGGSYFDSQALYPDLILICREIISSPPSQLQLTDIEKHVAGLRYMGFLKGPEIGGQINDSPQAVAKILKSIRQQLLPFIIEKLKSPQNP